MTWPSGTSVREQIMDNLLATLGAITAGGSYKSTVKLATLDAEKALKSPLHPCVVLVPPRVTYRDDRLDMIQGTLSTSLILVVRGYGTATVPQALWNLIEDVRLALFVDVTRGGVARDTHIESEEPFPLLLAQPEWSCETSINVQYAHDRLDPTTPR